MHDLGTAAIRVAEEGDATAIAAIYSPYVQNTAISFETEPPMAEILANRIARTLETHPWLVAEFDGNATPMPVSIESARLIAGPWIRRFIWILLRIAEESDVPFIVRC
jgi:hypothetical protein